MEQIISWTPQLAAVTVACIGGYTDLTQKRIPNRLTFPAMAAGLVLNFLLGGIPAFLDGFMGIVVGFSFFILFALGALKAGDVKLYMAIGALGGWRYGLTVMTVSVLIGGAAAFFIMAAHKNGRSSLGNLWNYFVNMFLRRQFYRYQPSEESSRFCFGWCIAAGAIAAVVFRIYEYLL